MKQPVTDSCGTLSRPPEICLRAANERIEHLEHMLSEMSGRAEVEWISDEMPGLVITRSQARILAALRKSSSVVTREAILAALYWDRSGPSDVAPKIVDVFVAKLRKQLRDAGYGDPIETIWGQGYRWSPDLGAD